MNRNHTTVKRVPALAAMDPEACWRAVLARDPRSDGKFVLAVRSTRIYCRPSCPARRPLRQNVVFYARPEDAERQERSTRDRVARACYLEVMSGRGTANGGIWLDVAHFAFSPSRR